MGVNKNYLILVAIFLLVLGVRLFFAFKTPNLTGDTSYFNLRQIESIRSTGFPIYNDDLSYSGRFYVFLPVFHYIISFFSLFLPLGVAIKLVPNLLISLTVFITYLISKEITKNDEASLVSALISGFLPIIFYTTVNSLSAYSVILPLSLGILLCLMRAERNKRYAYVFIGLIFLMTLTDSTILVLLFGFFVYLFLAWLVKLSPSKSEVELISFSTLSVILLSLILFKNALLLYGPDAIRQNIPPQLIAQYFARLNIFEAIYQIGVIPLVFGVYEIYKHLFVEKSRNLYVLISFALSVAILILLGLIELKIGLIYFSLVLSILSGSSYLLFSEYIKKTKFAAQHQLFVIGFLLLFVLSSVVPSIIYANLAVSEAVSDSQIKAFTWLRENTSASAVVLASEGEGHLLTALANRKNVADTNFLLQKDAEQILGDIRTIYTTRFQTDAIRLLNKYNVNYIVLSSYELEEYGIDRLSYVKDGDCFKLVYDNEIRIYESKCVVEEQ